MPKTAKIGHIHIKVSDLRKAEKFYTELLGLKVTERVANYLFLTFGKEHHDLALQEIPNAVEQPENSVGLYHFAIEVETLKDLVEIYSRLKKAGVRTYPTDHGISKAVYFSDTDGNGIEVYVDTRNEKKNWEGYSIPLNMEELLSHLKK